jgi:predicted nuclease of predicted toxin-antitoxin system
MRFLVDAHLPRGLCALLAQHGHDALHTLDLPARNATKDRVINRFRSMISAS